MSKGKSYLFWYTKIRIPCMLVSSEWPGLFAIRSLGVRSALWLEEIRKLPGTSVAPGIVAPIAAATHGIHVELLALAGSSGGLLLSHLNDSGFWYFKNIFA